MRIVVAEIVGCHGIDGELKLRPLTDNDHRFDPGNILFIEGETVEVESSFSHKGQIILKLLGLDDRNQAEKLIGKDITVDEEDLPDLPQDEFYVYELIGLDIVEKGEKKGELVDIITGVYPNDVYVVKKGEREVLLPAVRATIKNIDLKKREIEVENFEDYE